jgi:hypothetical protein
MLIRPLRYQGGFSLFTPCSQSRPLLRPNQIRFCIAYLLEVISCCVHPQIGGDGLNSIVAPKQNTLKLNLGTPLGLLNRSLDSQKLKPEKSILGPYRYVLRVQTLGKGYYCLNLWCYWEHIGEHYRKWWNSLGTWWEHIRKKSGLPLGRLTSIFGAHLFRSCYVVVA